jgi:three-Cys-motif partner protein
MIEDNYVVDEVGSWAVEKHSYLERYLDISRETRGKFLRAHRPGGAVYVDLFCGAGRAKIRDTDTLIDGSAMVAWRASVKGGAPFSKVFLCDVDARLLDACTRRLEGEGATVRAYCMPAKEAVIKIVADIKASHPYGLHFAFIDPFSLGLLDFSIIEQLAAIKRMDLMIHLSLMDLQRNLHINLQPERSAFNLFCPGWESTVDTTAPQYELRRQVIDYWRSKVDGLNIWPSPQHRLISGEQKQPLYDLLLVAGHELAHKFWGVASNPERQVDLF